MRSAHTVGKEEDVASRACLGALCNTKDIDAAGKLSLEGNKKCVCPTLRSTNCSVLMISLDKLGKRHLARKPDRSERSMYSSIHNQKVATTSSNAILGYIGLVVNV
jgi:hypothetical protein